jgi:hypothetical protein
MYEYRYPSYFFYSVRDMELHCAKEVVHHNPHHLLFYLSSGGGCLYVTMLPEREGCLVDYFLSASKRRNV